MNFDVNELNELYEKGYSLEDIVKMAQDQVLAAENKRREEIERAKQEELQKAAAAEIEELKQEARTYMINGLMCYCEAYGLCDDYGEEEYALMARMFEDYLIAVEPLLPLMFNNQISAEEAQEIANAKVDELKTQATQNLAKEILGEEAEVQALDADKFFEILAQKLGFEIVEEEDEDEEE